MSRLIKAYEVMRKNWARIAQEILINFAGPYAIYSIAQPHLGDVNALIASSGPPILWSLIEFLRHRRVDAVSVLALLGIGLSLLAFAGGGGVRFLQLRERLVTAVIGAVFLGSAAIGKPLIYELARASMKRANNQTELERFESLRKNARFRSTMTTLTVVWGLGLLADAAAAIALVFVLPIKTYLLVHPIVGYTTVGLLMLWSFWFGRKRRREGEARRRAETAAREAAPTASLA